MIENMALRLESDKPLETVVANIEKNAVENQFRVLCVHDVQQTLAEKGFERGPLKIIEVCNAGFAHRALEQDIAVAMFMPCRFTVHTDGDKTIVALSRPSMIVEMMPQLDLGELSTTVEATLIEVMEASI